MYFQQITCLYNVLITLLVNNFFKSIFPSI